MKPQIQTVESADPALCYEFAACSDPECRSCKAYVCMKCGEKDWNVQYPKSFGYPLTPLRLSDFEGEDDAEVKCDRCNATVFVGKNAGAA